MLTSKQKNITTGLGIGATDLGIVLLVLHHKEKKKSANHHSLTKKEFLKAEARGAERERKYLERVLHLDSMIHRLKRESKPEHITDYGNGVHVDKKGVHIDWKEARHDIGSIISHGWVNGVIDGLGGVSKWGK